MDYNFCLLLLLIFGFLKIEKFSTLATSLNGETFDFIVVGAGTGGCAVAARLAEIGEHSVLLISEGGVPPPDLDIPALTNNLLGDPNIAKAYQSVPRYNSGLSTNGTISYLVGRLLGGGSSINGMFLNRGHPQDYNNWAKLTGDESWSYRNLLKYFRKYENYTGNNPTDQRGDNGPITVSLPRYAPALKEWLAAGLELGYPNTGNRAMGVKIFTNSSGEATFSVVYARKEIIVTAGVLGLMRSGIGPREVLDRAEIPPVKYLPVGKNFHDHVGTVNIIIFGNKSAAFSEQELTPEAWTLYEQTGSGPYSSFWGSSGQAFLISPDLPEHEKQLAWPDIQLMPFNSNSTIYLQDSPLLGDLQEGETHVIWASVIVRPKSRGSVTLDLKNIDNPPLIDFNFFSHPQDIKNLIAGTKSMIRLCEDTSAFQGIGCRLPSIPISICSHLKFRSDAYWECYIRQFTVPALHAGGSCKMGSGRRDASAVVDTQLRVIGIENLRIADASVAPQITNANTQGAVYVIAEKAADMILKRWRN